MDYRSDAFRQRGPMLKHVRGLFCLAVAVAIPFTAGISQTSMNGSGNITHDYSGIPPMNLTLNPVPDANRFLESSMHIKENQKLIDALNLQRHKDMTLETAKLVVLAIQLKAETDQTSKDKVSVVELRKVELIEKLAKNVGERMKETTTNNK
jgi:hypothetical protein